MMLFLFIFWIISNAVFLRRDKSTTRDELVMLFTINAATFLLIFPLRNIFNIVHPNIENVIFTTLFLGCLAYISISIRSLCINRRLPSKYIAMLCLLYSSILGVLFIYFDTTSTIYVIHNCILASLGLLGWEVADLKQTFHPVDGFSHLFSTGSGGNSDNIVSNYTPHTNRTESLTMQLATLSHTIGIQFRDLNQYNLKFEDYFEKANHYKVVGNAEYESYYTGLARTERSTIRDNLYSLEQNISRRFALATQPQVSLRGSRFTDFCVISQSDEVTLNISRTLISGLNWNI